MPTPKKKNLIEREKEAILKEYKERWEDTAKKDCIGFADIELFLQSSLDRIVKVAVREMIKEADKNQCSSGDNIVWHLETKAHQLLGGKKI